MVDDAVLKVRKLLVDNGYTDAEVEGLLGLKTVTRDDLAKEAMKEIMKAQLSGAMGYRLDVEEISRLAYAQADQMMLRKALLH